MVADAKSLALTAVDLESVDGERKLKAKDLWRDRGAVILAIRRPGCALCRENAAQLYKLKADLDAKGIPLYGIVHENIPKEIKDFKPFFNTELFLDREKKFFTGYLGYFGFLKPSVWGNFRRASRGGYKGNHNGEGRNLGGVYVFGPNDQGLIYKYPEKVWGDEPSMKEVSEAVKKIRLSPKQEAADAMRKAEAHAELGMQEYSFAAKKFEESAMQEASDAGNKNKPPPKEEASDALKKAEFHAKQGMHEYFYAAKKLQESAMQEASDAANKYKPPPKEEAPVAIKRVGVYTRLDNQEAPDVPKRFGPSAKQATSDAGKRIRA